MNILVVEDSLIIRNNLEGRLKKEGFQVTGVPSGEAALQEVINKNPNIILLDLFLPGIDGLEVCKKIREYPKVYGTPHIIMLTGKTESKDIIDGFTVGADDYVKKPFEMDEVILRIKAVMRKIGNKSDRISFEDVILDLSARSTIISGNEIKLSKTEFNLLAYFVQNRGIALTRERIYEAVWEDEFVSGNRIIDVYIRKLKNKVDAFGEYIESLQGTGYILKNG